MEKERRSVRVIGAIVFCSICFMRARANPRRRDAPAAESHITDRSDEKVAGMPFGVMSCETRHPARFRWKPSAYFSPAPGGRAGNQSVDWPEALTFAHLALAMAESLARAAALTFRFFFFTEAAALAEALLALLALAQRALWAAPMRARAAADMRRFFLRPGTAGPWAAAPSSPAMESSLLCNASIFSLIATTLRSSATVKL